MSKMAKDQAWGEAKKKYRLFDRTVQMARKLGLNPHGLNPQKLGKIANHKQELWKEPLSDFIQAIFDTRFKLGEAS